MLVIDKGNSVLVRIYTREGDSGTTGYLGRGRLRKDDPRVQAVGSLDECNSALGLVLADPGCPDEIRPWLLRVQSTLFEAGTAAASTDSSAAAELLTRETEWVEGLIDRIEESLDPLTQFILPGGSPTGSGLHWPGPWVVVRSAISSAHSMRMPAAVRSWPT